MVNRRARRQIPSAFAVLLASCIGGAADHLTAPQAAEVSDLTEACFRLIQSPPHLWPMTLPVVLRHGSAASPSLESALRESPNAPGAAAVVAALGRVGNADCVALLRASMRDANEIVAAEAALALGRLRAEDSIPDLRAAMRDWTRAPLLRTAAAAAITAQQPDLEATGFLCDLILAGSPQGRARGQTLQLPVDRPRWALERNLAIEALQTAAGTGALDIDADASWPRLFDDVQRARARLGVDR